MNQGVYFIRMSGMFTGMHVIPNKYYPELTVGIIFLAQCHEQSLL